MLIMHGIYDPVARDDMIRQHPETWHQARWPYPRASVIRALSTWKDAEGRAYAPVDAVDAEVLEYSGSWPLWWVAYPARRLVDNLDTGDLVDKYRVVQVLVDAMYKKKVSIVALEG